jgi:DNA-binding response OmpR family regulator
MVLDIKMPEISGMDILLEMKKIDRNLPVVILSGSIGVEQNIEVLSELGYDGNKILYKPIDLNDLLEQIRQHLASC